MKPYQISYINNVQPLTCRRLQDWLLVLDTAQWLRSVFIQEFFFKVVACHCQRGLSVSHPLRSRLPPFPLEVDPLNPNRGVWGSAISSPWNAFPAQKRICCSNLHIAHTHTHAHARTHTHTHTHTGTCLSLMWLDYSLCPPLEREGGESHKLKGVEYFPRGGVYHPQKGWIKPWLSW